MAIDYDLAIKIAGPVVGGLATKILSDFIERRPRLICFYGHSSGVTLRPDPATGQSIRVHYHSVVVANKGREASKNVRIGHRTLPDFQIFPDIAFSRNNLPGGTDEILIPTLAPKEQITINYFYFAPLTYDQINLPIRSDEGLAKVITALPTPQMPFWVSVVSWCLIAYGGAALIYTILAVAR